MCSRSINLPFPHLFFIMVVIVPTRSNAQEAGVSDNCRPKIFLEALYRIGVEIPVGRGTSAIAAGDRFNKNYYIKAGIKRYCRKIKYDGMFFEWVAFYKEGTRTVSDNLRVPDSSGNYMRGDSNESGITKHVFGMNFEVGENLTLRHKRIRFEWYAGAGFRIKTSHASVTGDFQSHQLYHYNESFIEYFSSRQLTVALLPNISLGFRMSYLFKNRKKKTGWPNTQ